MKKRMITLCTVLAMTVSFMLSSFSFAQSSIQTTNKNNQVKEYKISDEYAEKYIKKVLGNKQVLGKLHRVVKPMSTPHVFKNTKLTSYITGGWGGYIAKSNNSVQSAVGNFYVPNNPTGCVSIWTGIGGFSGGSNTPLAQNGVISGGNEHWTFYELFPEPRVDLFNVNVGDRMYSSVSLDSDTGCWNMLIYDMTIGTYFESEFGFNPDTTTAEWVIEKYGNNPMGNFNVNFSNCSWLEYINGSYYSRNIDYDTQNLYQTTVEDAYGATATPSGISGGTDFSISH